LKTIGTGVCGTAKVKSGYPTESVAIRAAATKQKDWGKMGLMTVKSDKKMNIDDGDVLCMAWVDLNTVQYMTTVHSIDEMKTIIFNDAKRRKEVPESVVSDDKILLPASIVEYNHYAGGSDGNAQQRAYYSPHRQPDQQETREDRQPERTGNPRGQATRGDRQSGRTGNPRVQVMIKPPQ
jgi:hypothetical protein